MVDVITSVPRLRSLLALLCCLHVASACLQCDRKVRDMIDNYISDHAEVKPEDKKHMENARKTAYGGYETLAKEMSNGVIDPTTLYRATTEFLNAFESFKKEIKGTEANAVMAFINVMDHTGKGQILKKHLTAFSSEGVCPNECGLLRRKLKRCALQDGACPNEDKDCSEASRDCGEHVVRATEGDQVVLDCFLPWHGLLSGRKEYRYSWARGTHAPAIDDGDFAPLLVTEESGMVLNQLRVDQWGTYRCSLRDPRDPTVLFSRVTFRLHVDPVPTQPPGPPLTLPTLPAPAASRPPLYAACVAVTTLCLAASVAVTVLLGATMRRHARRLAGGD